MIGDLQEPWLELSDLSVIIVGGSLVAQMLGGLLADQGAQVLYVGSGSLSDDIGSDSGLLQRSYAIDLDDESGFTTLGQRIATTNVLVDSLADESLAENGFDLDHVFALQPTLLYCRLRAYPEAAIRDGGGHEWSVAASLGFHRLDVKGPPQLLPIPLASGYGALYAAVHIATALLEQARRQSPITLDMSVFGAALMALTGSLTTLDDKYAEAKGPFRAAGDLRYKCADERSIQITSNVPSVVLALFQAIDRPEWLEEALSDLTSETELRSVETWRERLSSVFAGRPAREWESLISAAGGACAECRTSSEWLTEPHARDTEIIITSGGSTTVRPPRAGSALRIFSPIKSHDSESASLESDVAGRGLPISNLETVGQWPLAGKRVVEFSVILAGPSAGRVLGELGADVIKVDAPHRAASPYIGQKGWLDVNRTKRSVLFDLRTSAGRDAAWRLIENADIVVQSYRTDKIAKLGFGPDETMGRNPRLVYVSLNAYDFGGPFSDRPGWEPLAQAVTGIHLEPDGEGVPPRVPLPMNDFGSGLVCAYGAILGLRTVQRTGRGVHVLASLSRTATFFSQTELGRESTDPARYLSGCEVQFLRSEDAWLTAAAAPGVLAQAFVLSPDLEQRIAQLTAAKAKELLLTMGIDATIASTVSDLRQRPWLRSTGLIDTWEHPRWGALEHAFPERTSTGLARRRGWPAPDPGEDTFGVLAEVGYSASEIEQMTESGAVRGRVPLFESA